MSSFLMKTFSSFLFVSDHGITFFLAYNFSSHFCFYIFTNSKLAISIYYQHFEFYFVTGITLHMRYIKCLVFFYFILLPGNFYYSYHIQKFKGSKGKGKCLSGKQIIKVLCTDAAKLKGLP